MVWPDSKNYIKEIKIVGRVFWLSYGFIHPIGIRRRFRALFGHRDGEESQSGQEMTIPSAGV